MLVPSHKQSPGQPVFSFRRSGGSGTICAIRRLVWINAVPFEYCSLILSYVVNICVFKGRSLVIRCPSSHFEWRCHSWRGTSVRANSMPAVSTWSINGWSPSGYLVSSTSQSPSAARSSFRTSHRPGQIVRPRLLQPNLRVRRVPLSRDRNKPLPNC
jgi:hypothetical protein